MKDAIIVLGRGINQDGSLPDDPKSRIRKAVELYKSKTAPRIIVCGGWSYRLEVAPDRTEALAMKHYAVELGVSPSDVIEETESKDTLGNAYFSKVDFCVPNGWHDLVVVSSEDHIERTKYIFNKVFGGCYSIEYKTADRVVPEAQYLAEQEHERKSMSALRKWLDSIPDGDDKALWQLMITKHPGYSQDPEYSREDLIRMINEEN